MVELIETIYKIDFACAVYAFISCTLPHLCTHLYPFLVTFQANDAWTHCPRTVNKVTFMLGNLMTIPYRWVI